MSTWFDKLLEELQRSQAEQDARREGRPFPPRPTRSERREWRRRGAGGGGNCPIPATPGGRPVRRWVLIGGAVVAAFFVLGLLGGVVNLITDLMWYGALGRSTVLTTRLWAQIGLFVVGFLAFAVPALVSIWLARRIAPQAPIRRLGQFELPDASTRLTWRWWRGRAARAGFSGRLERQLADDPPLRQWRRLRAPPTRTSAATSASTSSTCPSGASCWAGPVSADRDHACSALAAYAAGALRWQFHLTAPVRAHLSVLGALLLVVDRRRLPARHRRAGVLDPRADGNVQAAIYTDMNAQCPAYVILTVVALVSAALLLLNIWFRTLWLLGLAAGAWFVLSILVGGLYPGSSSASRSTRTS